MTDAQLSFADEGTGPAVVLLAEPGEGIAYLAALAHSVSTEDFRVVRVASQDVTEVVALLDELEIDTAWIGGHGAGGTVARLVAHEHHDRVNGVILFGVEEAEGLPQPEGLPVLVIQGSDDEVTPAANGDALRASAPGLVSVVTIDGAGHRFPATHIGETSWAIEDYLDWD